MSTTRGASPNHSVSDSSSAVRPSMCSMLLPISRSPVRLTMRKVMLRIEGEHRDVDLLHDGAEQRRGFDGAEALLVQRLGERVDFDQRRAERIVGVGGAAADREVVFAKRGQQVGQRLQRHDDARADRGGEAEQRAEDDDRQRPLDLRRVRLGPEDPQRGDRAGNAGAKREEEDLLIEPKRRHMLSWGQVLIISVAKSGSGA